MSPNQIESLAASYADGLTLRAALSAAVLPGVDRAWGAALPLSAGNAAGIPGPSGYGGAVYSRHHIGSGIFVLLEGTRVHPQLGGGVHEPRWGIGLADGALCTTEEVIAWLSMDPRPVDGGWLAQGQAEFARRWRRARLGFMQWTLIQGAARTLAARRGLAPTKATYRADGGWHDELDLVADHYRGEGFVPWRGGRRAALGEYCTGMARMSPTLADGLRALGEEAVPGKEGVRFYQDPFSRVL